jgi:hypothetical protein
MQFLNNQKFTYNVWGSNTRNMQRLLPRLAAKPGWASCYNAGGMSNQL